MTIHTVYKNAGINSPQKSGLSATTIPHTKFSSRNAGASTQMAPAFSMSSLIPAINRFCLSSKSPNTKISKWRNLIPGEYLKTFGLNLIYRSDKIFRDGNWL